MQRDEFTNILERRKRLMTEVLSQKGNEYSGAGDRLRNFKVAAMFQGITPERALIGMASKHWASVVKMVDDLDIDHVPSQESVDLKLGDWENYMILLEALLVERIALREEKE